MNYYIFVVNDQSKYGKLRTARETYDFLMEKEVWGFGENTNHLNNIKKDDLVIFYQAGGEGQKFLGIATLASGAYKDASSKDLFLDPETYKIDLENVKVWDKPKPIAPILAQLFFIKNKDYWGTYFQGGCRKISKKDYSTITRAKPPKHGLRDNKSLNYWVVRMGRGGKYVSKVKEKKMIALGWSDLEQPLSEYKNIDDLKKDVEQAYPDGSSAQTAGQLWRFYKEIKKGDIALIPVPFERTIIVTEVASSYCYKENSFPYPHRRKINILKTISRDNCSLSLKNSLGGLLTIYSVDAHAEEIQALIKGKSGIKEPMYYPNIYEAVINRLFELDAREFEKFIGHILNIAGFEAAVTSYIGDKGVDVTGNLNAEGLAQINLKVQVKRVHNSLGVDEVLRIRGTLAPDEHGCIITLSKFTKSAIEESDDERKKPIALIDGKGLVDLVLSHYEEIEDGYKKIIGVKPKKISLEDKFIF